MDLRHQVTRSLKLAVGEHIPVDETAGHPRRGRVVRPGDAVVEQSTLRPQLAVQQREVGRKLCLSYVLGKSDRTDRVEIGLRHLSIVEVTDFGEVGQTTFLDGTLSPRRLLS